MNEDNVVSLKKNSTRDQIKKVLDAYDAGIVQSIIIIGQGYDEEEGKSVLMPLVSEETTLSQACVANAILEVYATGAVTSVLSSGEHREL